MFLMLASLGMLFAASMLAYILIRTGLVLPEDAAIPPAGAIELPRLLWVSTALILASSFTIHRAAESLRHERQTRFRSSMTLTLLLAGAFLLVQTPSLASLLREHFALVEAGGDLRLYGLVFFFILVHALHVVGGVLPLTITTVRAHRGAYDHEHYRPVQYLAMYWHFLDVVWLVMFGTFLTLG